jgi:hypothetical protein
MPERIWRCPTREAIDKLASRFGLPNHPSMQDWEIEVSDPARIDEFLTVYTSGQLSDDEKFTLMETIIASFDELAATGGDLDTDTRWRLTRSLLQNNITLHAYSVWYWSRLDAEEKDEMFCVSPLIREVFAKHKDYFVEPRDRSPDAPTRRD